MKISRAARVFWMSLGLVVLPESAAWSQATGKIKDDALDALMEKLAESAGKPDAQAAQPAKPGGSAAKGQRSAGPGSSRPQAPASRADDQAKPAAEKAAKASSPRQSGASTVAPKDQELDELLQKLGETKESPAPDDRPGGAMAPAETKEPAGPSRSDRPARPRLAGKDKEIDDRLEELTGRRKRRNSDDGQRPGAIGEIIKEMRDVEQRLGKPDTGEGTRQEQERIVKRIETLIEEMRRSGSMGQMMIRRMRRQGREPGQQPGSTTGALARGVGPQKPLRPTNRHSNAGGKDTWGHLPPELRQEMENQSHEEPLTLKKELIDRYYLSVGKGKLVREE